MDLFSQDFKSSFPPRDFGSLFSIFGESDILGGLIGLLLDGLGGGDEVDSEEDEDRSEPPGFGQGFGERKISVHSLKRKDT